LASHVIGLLMGSAALGGLLALTRRGLPHSELFALIATGVILVAGIGWFGRNLPSVGFEVPLGWRRLGDYGYATVFGLCLGTGWLTRVPSLGFYVINAWMLLSEHPQGAYLSFMAFALGKSVPAGVALISTQLTDKNFTWTLARYKAVIPWLMMVESGLVALGTTSLM
jgi:hypothetical protein